MRSDRSIRKSGLPYHRVMLALVAVVALVTLFNIASGQQVHRDGFEARNPVWQKGPTDASAKEIIHDVTDQTAHTGQLSEHIQFNAEQGTYVQYFYPTSRAPLGEELAASVWIKANRPGIQLMARLVLPKERQPNNLNEPLTTLLRGDQYQTVGRWQKLDLRRPVKVAKEQQQLLRAELNRDIDFTDAYVDRLILNGYGGPGATELWIDDLEIGPVLDKEANAPPAGPLVPGGPAPVPEARHALIELKQDKLLVNGKRFFFRGIRHTDTPLKALRDAGFNTIWLDPEETPESKEEAINLGLWLVPPLMVPVSAGTTPEPMDRTIAKFLEGDAVLFWDLGGGKTVEEAQQVMRNAQAVHAGDPQRPIGADVWDGFMSYSRDPNFMIGAHRWPLMTSLELPQYREWLNQRRLLARPGTFMWTWIQTHLPDWYTALVYDRAPEPNLNHGRVKGASGFDDPIGPQPEQIRLLTYLALSAGSQGLGFWSDRFLADSHQGRDRLLTLALLNQEIQMLEPMLLTCIEAPGWVETSQAEVKAAVFRTERGVLVVPMWLGKGAQYVPGQSAAARISVVIPAVPTGTQAWEISPGDVRSLPMQRVAGGTKITLPEFGLTSAIVFTSDNSPNGLLVRFQEHVRRTRKLAAQWSHDLAQVEIEKVLKVENELEKAGHTLPDGKALKDDAQARLKTCVDYWNSGDYRESYAEAQRALRPLRVLMRAQWELATKDLDTPVASQFAVSFYSLPKHWELAKQIQTSKAAANVLPDGDFEATPDKTPTAWLPQEITLDEVDLGAWRVTDEPRQGKRCLKLEVKPKNPLDVPKALERTFLAINSPAVKLQPGTLVRISGWVRIPKAITASADGALLYDSAGGEPLAIRLTEPTVWKKYTLYRKVPASGTINVTLALTGIGTVFFDDVRIEPMLAGNFPAHSPMK